MKLEPGKYFVALRDQPNQALAMFEWDGSTPIQLNDHLGLLDVSPDQFESQVLRMDLGGYYVVRRVGDGVEDEAKPEKTGII